jgi:hypothetical protein
LTGFLAGGWLALRLIGSLNWLFAALAFGLIVYGLRAYGGDHIRGMVWSRAIHKCARLAITMNVASRFCVIVVWSNAKRLQRFERLERLEPFGSYVSWAN